jgi:hypothetical protein
LSHRYKQQARFLVHSHGFGTRRCIEYRKRRVGVGRFLAKSVNMPVAGGCESDFAGNIEHGCVRLVSDWERRDDFSGSAVNDRHHPTTASEKQAIIAGIEGHAGGRFTGRYGPTILTWRDLESMRRSSLLSSKLTKTLP